MATGRVIDCAMVAGVCRTQAPAWFNTAGQGRTCLDKVPCIKAHRSAAPCLTWPIETVSPSVCLSLSFQMCMCLCLQRRAGLFKAPALRLSEQSLTNYGRPSALWFPVQANIGQAYTHTVVCYALMMLVNPNTSGQGNPSPKLQTPPRNTFSPITASWSFSTILLQLNRSEAEPSSSHHFYLLDSCNVGKTLINTLKKRKSPVQFNQSKQ